MVEAGYQFVLLYRELQHGSKTSSSVHQMSKISIYCTKVLIKQKLIFGHAYWFLLMIMMHRSKIVTF